MRAFTCIVFLLAAISPAGAQDVPEYAELRASRPDGRTVPVNGLTIVRDAFTIELRSGAVHLLAPLGDHTFGAVFLGEGAYRLAPSTEAERRHLRLVTGDDGLETLSDEFTRLVLLFTDRTEADLLAHAPVQAGSPEPAAARAYDDYLERQRSLEQPNLHVRVLADHLNRPQRQDGVFLAFVDGRRHSRGLMAVDPLGISHLTARFGFYGGEEVAFISFDRENGGFWYSSTYTEAAVSGRGKSVRPLADATHYDVDATIEGRTLRGVTTITFQALADGVRMLPVNIFNKLKIRSATVERGTDRVPVGVIQEEVPQGWLARLVSGEVADADVAVVLPAPLARGESARLRFEYDGSDVLEGEDGYYSVRARESWYPNLGTFTDLATYQLTFNFPQRNELVSVGEQVSQTVENGRKIAVWRSQAPIRVAGFNYGEFRTRSQEDAETGVEVHVYTNRDWTSMAGSVLADAVNTSRLGDAFFGPPPFSRLSLAQQVEWQFGQSWPSLVFIPTTALLTSTQRNTQLAIDPRAQASLNEFANTVAWHEVAHQWWGHQVGWSSYRDQWLSEGFAEFTAALMLEVTSGRPTADRFWELRRTEVLDRTSEVASAEAGPITQGYRLSTKRSPAAASAMLYAKGAYVVHMLRMMMRDSGGDPDRQFKAMMREFVTAWAGKNPSTDDFKAIAERHMTPGMDLAGTKRLDYFFDQWVYGTSIPNLGSTLEVTELGNRRYRISGVITQQGVPDGFRTLVPIYLDFGNNRVERLGTIPLSGPVAQKVSAEIELPQRPRRALINAWHDVLSY